MRKAFVNTLLEVAGKDSRIYLLTGDLGFSVLEPFRKEFPKRFVNMGVAEQNMIGVAAGLALSGKIVFVYSIVPFVTMRCFEQIRNDLCFQNLRVRLVGVGGGFSYGTAGPTHYALEDMAIMRSLFNMTVIAPGDPKETEMAVKASIKHPGPVYIRIGGGIGGKGTPVYSRKFNFRIGKGILIEDGSDVTIIATGSMLQCALESAGLLKERKISVRLISMPTVKPVDERIILDSLKKTKAIFTVEEHNTIGGLGSAVSEVLIKSKPESFIFRKFAVPDKYIKETGTQKYLLNKYGLSSDRIAKEIISDIKRRK